MGNNSVPKFIFRLSRFPVYRGSVLGRFYCISIFKHTFEVWTNCQNLRVKSSNPDNEYSIEASCSNLLFCTCWRSPYSCRNPAWLNSTPFGGNGNMCARWTVGNRNLEQFSYLITLLHVAFRNYQQIQSDNRCRELTLRLVMSYIYIYIHIYTKLVA